MVGPSTLAATARTIWRSRRNLIAWSLPLLLALVIMIPRLEHPRFGLLDDGVTLRMARQLSEHLGSALTGTGDSGRFVPAYWLYYSILYLVLGASAKSFFIANALVLMACTSGLMFLIYRYTDRRGVSILAGALFVLGQPVVESFYTLSKPEPQVVLLVLLSLVVIQLYSDRRTWAGRVAVVAASAALLWLANATKEPAMVMAPISFAWVALARAQRMPRSMLMARVAFLAAALAAAIGYLVARTASGFASLESGSYTRNYEVSFGRMSVSAWGWIERLTHDYPFLVVLALAFLPLALRRPTSRSVTLDLLVWMSGWIGVFLPWRSQLDYYLLPFNVGAAALAAILAHSGWQLLAESTTVSRRGAIWAAFGISILLFQTTLFNYTSAARVQVAVDQANSKLVRSLAELPERSRVFINIPHPNEYIYEIGVHLSELRARPDLRVSEFRGGAAMREPGVQSYYVATPHIVGQQVRSVRIAVYETGAKMWRESLFTSTPQSRKHEIEIRRGFDIVEFGFDAPLCDMFEPGSPARRCVSSRVVAAGAWSYGWDVFQVRPGKYAHPGFFADGEWQFHGTSKSVDRFVLGEAGDLPLVGDWDGDGAADFGVFRPASQQWLLQVGANARPSFSLPGMEQSDLPVVGDWDGNGTDTPGFFRARDATWHLRNHDVSASDDWRAFSLGKASALPVVGDWNGDGRDTPASYDSVSGTFMLTDCLGGRCSTQVYKAPANAIPVAGDWHGSGSDSVAYYVNGEWQFDQMNCFCSLASPPPALRFSANGVPVAVP